MLEEIGTPYVHVPVQPHSTEIRQINPLGKIPALVDGNFSMSESAAINTYLGDRYGKAFALVPPGGTLERGRYDQIVMMIQCELDSQGLWIHRKHEALGQIFGNIPEAVAHARKHSAKIVKCLVEGMSGQYLLGSGFSAADILFVHCLDWARSIGWLDEWEISNADLKPYAERCRSRVAYQRAKALP